MLIQYNRYPENASLSDACAALTLGGADHTGWNMQCYTLIMSPTSLVPIPEKLAIYHWRLARMDDVPAVCAMLAAGVQVDRPFSPPSEAHLAHLYGLLGQDLAQNTLLALMDDNSVVAEAFIFFPPADEEHIALLDGHVHIRHRNRGLGGYLLSWLEGRARQEFSRPRDAESPSDRDSLPLLLRMSCAAHQSDRIALFEQYGFQAARYSYTMQRDLQEPIPDLPLPSGVQIHRWDPALDLAVMDAFNLAFQGHWGVPVMTPDLWRVFFTGAQFRPDLSCVALAGDEVVAFCINWVVDGNGWIEAVGVVPGWRGGGIASALLAHSLRQFQQAGLEQAALDVDADNPTGALRLYQKLGFSRVKEEIHFVKQLV
jgi:ribosomal protein S18 acetylase RimI-like enzyme